MMDELYGQRCDRCGGFTNAADQKITFSPEALTKGLEEIFKGMNVRDEIQQDIFHETLRLFNLAAAKGISEAYDEEAITDEFLEQIRHNNEVFSAFRTHRMQNDIAKQLLDEKGQLKPFYKFKKDVEPLTGKYCDQWLNTEYNTAIIRAHRAAEWKHFETEKDVYPNLRWMPTTSINPDPVHESFWSRKLTLPIDDPFWSHHQPGERWNCKCSCEQTDEPVNDLGVHEGMKDTANTGLHGNPAETGKLFSEDHPYYPKNCAGCPFNDGVKNRLTVLVNAGKDCAACRACAKAIQEAKAQNEKPNEYYTEEKFGERLKICKGADQTELTENKRCLESLLGSFPDITAVIRKHVLEPGVKNPEYLINGLLADRKGIMSEKGIAAAFNKAIKQGCKAVVIDLDMNIGKFNEKRLCKHIQWRHSDFEDGNIETCYIVYCGKAVKVSLEDFKKANVMNILVKLKP